MLNLRWYSTNINIKLGYVSRFWTSSLFNRSTSLLIGRWSSVVDVFKNTLLTNPCELGFVEVIRTIGHTVQICMHVVAGVEFNISQTFSGLAGKGSICNRPQKWTKTKRNMAVSHIVLIKQENTPRNVWAVRWKIPCGGKIMLVFMVSKLLGDIGLKSFGSLDGKVRVSWIDNSFYFT